MTNYERFFGSEYNVGAMTINDLLVGYEEPYKEVRCQGYLVWEGSFSDFNKWLKQESTWKYPDFRKPVELYDWGTGK